jgi:hypothetical protein
LITPEEQAALIHKWCRGNAMAADFIAVLFEASHLADDIVDGDSEDVCADMTTVWQLFFGRLMPNPFFLQHAERFAGAIVPAVVDWRLATAWQGDKDEIKRLYAYVLRETLEHAAVVAADIVGGANWAFEVRRELSTVCHIEQGREPLSQWLKEH